MLLLYGEGDRAFLRLQEQVLKAYTDFSIFLWFSDVHESDSIGDNQKPRISGLLAQHPSFFDSAENNMLFPYSSMRRHDPNWLSAVAKPAGFSPWSTTPSITPAGILFTQPAFVRDDGSGELLVYINFRARREMLFLKLRPFSSYLGEAVLGRSTRFQDSVFAIPLENFQQTGSGINALRMDHSMGQNDGFVPLVYTRICARIQGVSLDLLRPVPETGTTNHDILHIVLRRPGPAPQAEYVGHVIWHKESEWRRQYSVIKLDMGTLGSISQASVLLVIVG